jgi:hypothetical protein
MSKYAKINSDGVVENIIVCEDSDISSQTGIHIKVSDSTNNAEIGYEYVWGKNKFKPVKMYDSWILNEETQLWESPVEIPSDATISVFGTVTNYRWNEDDLSWDKV